ncbi:hypothetical protein GIB67_000215 [Kingdonia uniflora]|uniref:NB-ARC domain-containing protein n=1 Tax=Kingdonia uniflora TaxID=39325 RepID=A0A7J7P9K8_9MAGN|nr:hypothetical protein GIB67_000215 [Kingdonia uniflora]
MVTTRNIEVKVLLKNDSLKLFRQEVCDVDFDARRKCSKKIIDKCDGLPLAIVTLARTLRKKEEGVWIVVIQQLKKSMFEGLNPVNASIKMSYDFFESSKTKLCFLLCALYPEDHKVTMDTLVGYAMGEDFLGDVEILREARGNLHLMVGTLVSSGLLLKGEDARYVMMHDIVRDVAILIAHESIMRVRMLEEVSVIGNLKTLEILSLQGTGILRLLEEISGLTNLKMLDLSYTRNLKCIPPKKYIISNQLHLGLGDEEEGLQRMAPKVRGGKIPPTRGKIPPTTSLRKRRNNEREDPSHPNYNNPPRVPAKRRKTCSSPHSNRQLFGNLNIQANYSHKEPVRCVWLKPNQDEVMINTDGSMTGNIGAFGAVIRSYPGIPLKAATGNCKAISVSLHELQGKLARTNSFDKACLGTDSAMAIMYIKKQVEPPWEGRWILREIHRRIDEFTSFSSPYL